MDIYPTFTPSPEPRDPNATPPDPVPTATPAPTTVPTPVPVSNPVAPVQPTPTPLAQDVVVAQPVVESAPAPAPAPIPEPAPGEVFTTLNNSSFVEPAFAPMTTMRTIPPAGGKVAVAPVARKRRWPLVLVFLVLLIVGSAAAYVFGYDRTVVLSSKDVLALALTSDIDAEVAAGHIDAGITVETEVPDNQLVYDEGPYAMQTSTEEAKIEFAVSADIGRISTDDTSRSYVTIDPLTIKVTPERLLTEQGLPARISAAFEVRAIDTVLYAQITRLSPEISSMISSLAGMNVVDQWVSFEIESNEADKAVNDDSQEILKRILDEAVVITSNKYMLGSRQIDFTLDNKVIEEIVREEIKKQGGEYSDAYNEVDFTEPLQVTVLIDRFGAIVRTSLSAKLADSENTTRIGMQLTYVRNDNKEIEITAPENSINLQQYFEGVTTQSKVGVNPESIFDEAFSQAVVSTVNEGSNKISYKDSCKMIVEKINQEISVPNEILASVPGYEIKNVRCFDAVNAVAFSFALYQDDVAVMQSCFDSTARVAVSQSMPIADPSVRCVATVR